MLWIHSLELQDLLDEFATKRKGMLIVPIRHMNMTDKPQWTLGKKDSSTGGGIPYS